MLSVMGCTPAPAYKDGVFEVKSPGSFTSEPYLGNYVFLDLCRNEIKGQKLYSAKLMEKQSLSGVDAISGATWSHEPFKASVKKALAMAKKRTEKDKQVGPL
jgi:hypothetical protein